MKLDMFTEHILSWKKMKNMNMRKNRKTNEAASFVSTSKAKKLELADVQSYKTTREAKAIPKQEMMTMRISIPNVPLCFGRFQIQVTLKPQEVALRQRSRRGKDEPGRGPPI